VCHGANAEGGKIGTRLTGGKAEIESFTTLKPVRTLGAYWPYATTVWDYINERCLAIRENAYPNEVYALTAFVLSKSNIIKEDDVMDGENVAESRDANRNGFVPAKFADIPDEKKTRMQAGRLPVG